MKSIAILAFAVLAASAQDNVFFKGAAEARSITTADGANGLVRFEFEGKTVTGAPYSAQAVTESTQVLADGNRITRKTTSSVARDSMGRTRREQNLDFVGPWATTGKPPTMLLINDPVSGTRYSLNSNSHSAVKMPGGVEMEGKVRMGVRLKQEAEHNASFTVSAAPASQTPPKVESLGSQTIGGVMAEGKRVTETIPAGRIGNERDINIVSETWYSPDLQTVVMSKNSDPRSGDVVYTLTNITRAEPDPALFQIPADYKVNDEPMRTITIQDRQP